MSGVLPRVFSIPPGAAFLPTLADALLSGRLLPDFRHDGDPLELASATIYVPTRRAARELRSVFVEKSAGGSAILPTVRPLGEFDEDEAAFGEEGAGALDLAPPISAIDRLLHLAPLVRAWKKRLPAHVAALFEEEMVVPASAADAIWLARDLAALMDEIETEGSDWTRLAELAPENLSGWWQVTLDFLSIVTEHWPDFLAARGQSNPAAHRSALIRLEAERLRKQPAGRAGDRGGLDRLHSGDGGAAVRSIARLPNGAVVLPGLDKEMDEPSWSVLTGPAPKPAVLGHPQYGLAKLHRQDRHFARRCRGDRRAGRGRWRCARGLCRKPCARPRRPTNGPAAGRGFGAADIDAALAGVTLVEAPRERDEAAAIAIALQAGGRGDRRQGRACHRRPRSWRGASRRSSCASAFAPTIPAARRSPTRRRQLCCG